MPATTVGDTALKIIISDNSTPGSGTYAWYVNAHASRMKWPMEFVDGTYIASMGGTTIGQKAFKRNILWQFRDIPITSNTDLDNLVKMVAYWEANDTLLYLSVKTTTFTTEIAAIGTQSGSTTRNQMRGVLQNFTIDRIENDNIWVGIEFVFQSA